jgi:hypothetical protein
VLFSNLRNLIWRESFGYPDQRWPEAAMDEGDPALDKAANENIFTFGHRLKDCEDLMTLRMSPPTAFDWPVDNRLRKP